MLRICVALCASQFPRSPVPCSACAILYSPHAQPTLQDYLKHPHSAISTAINTSASPGTPSSPLASLRTSSSLLPSILHHHLPLPFLFGPVCWNTTEILQAGGKCSYLFPVHAITSCHPWAFLSWLRGHTGMHAAPFANIIMLTINCSSSSGRTHKSPEQCITNKQQKRMAGADWAEKYGSAWRTA
eukprot:scaffold84173_cov17-Tisochrysis_lutea.AAC.1